jgi:hypothetical protein
MKPIHALFTSATAQRQRLLRPFSHINDLRYDNLPLGKVKVHSLQVLANRRFANGFTANAALSFNHTRELRTVNEFDREPTLWWDPNNSRPYRLSGGAVYAPDSRRHSEPGELRGIQQSGDRPDEYKLREGGCGQWR